MSALSKKLQKQISKLAKKLVVEAQKFATLAEKPGVAQDTLAAAYLKIHDGVRAELSAILFAALGEE